MNFQESITTCFKKYATFEGRASRSEYWYWVLAMWITIIVMQILAIAVHFLAILALIVNLAILVPSIAVTARRLHDVDRSGWWQLLVFIPLIGAIVWEVTKGTVGDNRFGKDPL